MCFGPIIGGGAVKARPVTMSRCSMWAVNEALQGHQEHFELDALMLMIDADENIHPDWPEVVDTTSTTNQCHTGASARGPFKRTKVRPT